MIGPANGEAAQVGAAGILDRPAEQDDMGAGDGVDGETGFRVALAHRYCWNGMVRPGWRAWSAV